MPWSTPPQAARTMLKNLGASPGSRLWRMWLHVANSCVAAGKLDEVRCIRSANATVQRAAKGDIMYHEPIEYLVNEPTNITTDKITGREVLQVQVIFTREAVMNGRFKPWSELQQSFWTLERKPVITPTHPPDGEPVTSRVFNNIVGYISDVHLHEADHSVRGLHNYFLDHSWVEENLDKIGTEQRATSVGYYAITEELESNEAFNGVSYNLVDRFMYFDHDAHLVNVPAACPVPSCGIMVNEEGYNMETDIDVSAEEFVVKLQQFLDENVIGAPTSDPDEDAEHPKDCPPGQHMVEGKCVKKDEDEKHDNCNCNEVEGEQLNTQENIVPSDNMSEGTVTTSTETSGAIVPEVPADDPSPPVLAPATDIESRIMLAENTMLKQELEAAKAKLEAIDKKEVEADEAKTIRLRDLALQLNAVFKVYNVEDINKMDRAVLEQIVPALQVKARPELKSIFSQKVGDSDPYASDYRFAPLTVFANKLRKEGVGD